ncbi:hypothetical protein BD311DRAFT_758057 [Dichomitus squalens]|uniref:Uncharacterized protein n=1 Tax=Dichomitus squalens TaxID=114155 RepID=A0A4Q9MCF9_9APHY|nr:hypothetical protein BD311DRAFT_768325 [Dichomitus squalens]TBU28601.1 hypothetical protein BD311DRAFT_758057 [Dichomitus squalens]
MLIHGCASCGARNLAQCSCQTSELLQPTAPLPSTPQSRSTFPPGSHHYSCTPAPSSAYARHPGNTPGPSSEPPIRAGGLQSVFGAWLQ